MLKSSVVDQTHTSVLPVRKEVSIPNLKYMEPDVTSPSCWRSNLTYNNFRYTEGKLVLVNKLVLI